jgi:hypothetical protein
VTKFAQARIAVTPPLTRLQGGEDAAPLSVQATFETQMTVLLAILGTTLALAWRARVVQRCWNPAQGEHRDESGLVDACARASLLVLMSLLGLLALGVMYGNVLGAGNTTP